MSSVKLGRDTEEFKMFHEYWRIVQEYWSVEENKPYWEALIEAIGRFTERFNNELALGLAQAFFEAQEKKFKEVKK